MKKISKLLCFSTIFTSLFFRFGAPVHAMEQPTIEQLIQAKNTAVQALINDLKNDQPRIEVTEKDQQLLQKTYGTDLYPEIVDYLRAGRIADIYKKQEEGINTFIAAFKRDNPQMTLSPQDEKALKEECQSGSLCLAGTEISGITVIPEEIKALRFIHQLLIESTSIKTLPETIGMLHCLIIIELYENPSLKTLPKTIGNLAYLHTLVLTQNTSLETLSLSGKLQYLQQISLEKCSNIVVDLKTLSNLLNRSVAKVGLFLLCEAD